MDQGPGHGGSWVAGNTFENQHDGFVNAVQWFPAQGGGGEGEHSIGLCKRVSEGQSDVELN